jgi:tetratricopeptide (TPR) repeat protein
MMSAVLAEGHGEHEIAAELFAEAAEQDQDRSPIDESFALVGRGRALVALGRHEQAAEALRRARSILQRLRLAPDLAEADALLQ